MRWLRMASSILRKTPASQIFGQGRIAGAPMQERVDLLAVAVVDLANRLFVVQLGPRQQFVFRLRRSLLLDRNRFDGCRFDSRRSRRSHSLKL